MAFTSEKKFQFKGKEDGMGLCAVRSPPEMLEAPCLLGLLADF